MATKTSATTATRTNKSSTESPRSPSMALLMAAERDTRRGGAKETETSDIGGEVGRVASSKEKEKCTIGLFNWKSNQTI